jgi:hypothetical protein
MIIKLYYTDFKQKKHKRIERLSLNKLHTSHLISTWEKKTYIKLNTPYISLIIYIIKFSHHKHTYTNFITNFK